jgi:hypothetical protein
MSYQVRVVSSFASYYVAKSCAEGASMTTVEYLKTTEFWLQKMAPGVALVMGLVAFAWTW